MLILLLNTTLVGCYTILNHPTVIEDDATPEATAEEVTPAPTESESADISHNVDCIQCHTPEQHQFVNRYYDHYDLDVVENSELDYYWGASSTANFYYQMPWWVNDFYYSVPTAGGHSQSNDSLPNPNDYSRRRSSGSYDQSVMGNSTSGSAGGVSSMSSSSSSNQSSKNDDQKQRTSVDRRHPESGSKSPSNQPEDKSKSSSKETKKND
jgi:hypothetical protein